jgi:phosphoglycolate phosphatase-like HAD superfamily hydrolase
MTKSIVIVDLDGTLCNSGHREHLAVAKDWDAFHSLLGADEPWADVKQMIELLGEVGHFYLVGLTGRNEKYRAMTHQWLMNNDIFLDNLLMRPDWDPRPDHELKPQMLAEMLQVMELTKDNVWFILEDRDRVTEAYRNLGYNVWQVRVPGF